MSLYNKDEIDEIIKCIEKYKIFYLKSNSLPTYHLSITIFVLIILLKLVKNSFYFIPLLALTLVRLFVIFHDCCHNSFFKITKEQYINGDYGYNKIVSEILEPLVGYDEYSWRTGHSRHHKNQGNMLLEDEARTVILKTKYDNYPLFKKILYRIFRNPIVFFPLAAIYIFLIQHLFKILYILKVIILYYFIYILGGLSLLKKFIIAQYIGGIFGLILFHLQHCVNDGYFEKFKENDSLSRNRASLHGSSFLKIPYILKWFTFGIEYHHIHHMSPRIPSYNLQKCHEENIEKFNKVTQVNILKAFKSIFHILYDEKEKRYISSPINRFFGLEG